jgi:ornithine decarboxylase
MSRSFFIVLPKEMRRHDEGFDSGPCLVVDLDVVCENYLAFARALPDSRVFYAVKTNPAPELLTSASLVDW